MPLAFFLTFTTYGTWLHGTDKGAGSVDRTHNEYGTPYLPPDPDRLAAARAAMTQPPYALDAPRHAVVTADRDPGRLLSDLKARASRDLTRAGFETADRIRWTRHGSTRYLFDEGAVRAKVHYTLEEQGPPMATYDGTTDAATDNTSEPRTK